MQITYYGTSASEGWPALFCECKACQLARVLGGKNIRSRSQVLIDESLLVDFPPDTNYHVQKMNLDLRKVKSLLITHSHHDHFFPEDICMRNSQYAQGVNTFKLMVYGNSTVIQKLKKCSSQFYQFDKFVQINTICPFDQFITPDGYRITALPADHNAPEQSLIYIIEKKQKKILYAHDTGVFPEVTWDYLKDISFDFISLDCTGLSRPWRSGHLGFESVDFVCARLKNIKCITANTQIVLSHFAHDQDYTHEKILELQGQKGYKIAYDGVCYYL